MVTSWTINTRHLCEHNVRGFRLRICFPICRCTSCWPQSLSAAIPHFDSCSRWRGGSSVEKSWRFAVNDAAKLQLRNDGFELTHEGHPSAAHHGLTAADAYLYRIQNRLKCSYIFMRPYEGINKYFFSSIRKLRCAEQLLISISMLHLLYLTADFVVRGI